MVYVEVQARNPDDGKIYSVKFVAASRVHADEYLAEWRDDPSIEVVSVWYNEDIGTVLMLPEDYEL